MLPYRDIRPHWVCAAAAAQRVPIAATLTNNASDTTLNKNAHLWAFFSVARQWAVTSCALVCHYLQRKAAPFCQRRESVSFRDVGKTGDIFLDRMRDAAFYDRDTFNFDRVEVWRGSASMLFGRGTTDGAVNQLSKVP